MSTLERLQRQTLSWRHRLDVVVATLREMSRQTDPLEMRSAYGKRMRELFAVDRFVSLSRRDLQYPEFRVTRASGWTEEINPWKERHRLPLYRGGLLAELIYGDEPRIIHEFQPDPDDPAYEYLQGMGSLMAVPHFDGGIGLNMVVTLREQTNAFDEESFPEQVQVSGLFGRATQNLVLSGQLREALEAVDRELSVVGDIQRSLLPAKLPDIPGLSVAAHYQTSRRAGGDYYDFFALPDGQWGILIADVSGHGTPAAVLMAVMHSLAHAFSEPPSPPARLLHHLNSHLCERYTGETGTFVTAFYAVYNPKTRGLRYSSAGHPPPRMKSCMDGTILSLDEAQRLPLGIFSEEEYSEAAIELRPGDQLILFTDGITEAENPAGQAFGLEQLDRVLSECARDASDILQSVLLAVEDFTAGAPAADDRTVLVAKLR